MCQTAFAFMPPEVPRARSTRARARTQGPTIRGWQIADGPFRYLLGREWAEGGKLLGIVGLNPSRATGEKNDATVTWCVNLAQSLGYDGLIIANLFAYRATDPRELRDAVDPIGPKNDQHLYELASRCLHGGGRIVLAHGAPLPVPRQKGAKHHPFFKRAQTAIAVLLAGGAGADGAPPTLYCLDVTKDGHPHHPRGLATGVSPREFIVSLVDVSCPRCGTILAASAGASATAQHVMTCKLAAPAGAPAPAPPPRAARTRKA